MTYPPPSDYSDRLARVNCQLEILQDLDPDGEWSKQALVHKWIAARYTFTLGEFKTLELFLASEVTRITEDPSVQIPPPSGEKAQNS